MPGRRWSILSTGPKSQLSLSKLGWVYYDGLRNILLFSRLLLTHLARAAFKAISRRRSGVRVWRRRFPPIFPPRLPITAMNWEI